MGPKSNMSGVLKRRGHIWTQEKRYTMGEHHVLTEDRTSLEPLELDFRQPVSEQ